MAKRKLEKDPTILEAVDNLSSMAEIDVKELKGDEKNKRGALNTLRWLDSSDERKTVELVKSNLKVVLNYLKHIHTKEAGQLHQSHIKKGIVSIIELAQEAVDKIEKYGKQCKRKIDISNSKEYTALMDFYQKSIKGHFEKKSEHIEEEEELDPEDTKRRGLYDLEGVKRDDDYELFYLQKEDGGKFYNPNIARHIRLVADFDKIISGFTLFDPLTKVPVIKDSIAFHLCRQLKDQLKKELDHIFKSAGSYKQDPLVQDVFKGLMALMLASNAKNQLKITTGKSVSGYFKDFQTSLRAVLSSMDYRNYLDSPPKDEFYRELLNLLHKVCAVVYTSRIHTEEVGSILATMMGKGEKRRKTSGTSSVALWNALLDEYDVLQSVFESCPNGPIFKILDILNEEGAFSEFDPMFQGDFPGKYFSMKYEDKKTDFLKIPSPTIQKTIDEATLSFEFKGFLRSLVNERKKLLLINFQDKTCWKEYARAHVVEKGSLEGEFKSCLTVISFPKSTDFYHQREEYVKVDSSTDFKKIFYKQIEGEANCGFLFPKKLDRKEFFAFIKKMIDEIHTLFFSGKKVLSRKNRLDFIEIGYHLIYLYFIKLEKADFTAFSAKDGVDVSAVAIASMFGFLKSFAKEGEWKVEDEDFLIETIYSTAFIVRERATQMGVLHRSVSMLSVVTAELEVDKKKVQKALKGLFDNSFSSIFVSH